MSSADSARDHRTLMHCLRLFMSICLFSVTSRQAIAIHHWCLTGCRLRHSAVVGFYRPHAKTCNKPSRRGIHFGSVYLRSSFSII